MVHTCASVRMVPWMIEPLFDAHDGGAWGREGTITTNRDHGWTMCGLTISVARKLSVHVNINFASYINYAWTADGTTAFGRV